MEFAKVSRKYLFFSAKNGRLRIQEFWSTTYEYIRRYFMLFVRLKKSVWENGRKKGISLNT